MKRILFALTMFAVLLGTACKTDWDEAYAHAPMRGLPEKLPQSYQTGLKVTVYSSKPISQEEKNLIDQGVMEQLATSYEYTAKLGWDKFTKPSDYRVLLLDSDIRAESPDIKGCVLIDTYGGRSAGTVAGVWGNTVRSPVIIVPRQADLTHCGLLFKNGIKHESEHVRLTNNMAFYNFLQGPNDIHPLFELWIFRSNTDIEPVEAKKGEGRSELLN